MQGAICLIVGGLLLGGGISQFIIIPQNKSKLVWSSSGSNSTGSDTIILPGSPNGYFLIIEAYHSVQGYDYTVLDILFLHSESSESYIFYLVVLSGSYRGWFDDTDFIYIPSGEYDVSWNCSGVLNYRIFLYIDGIFNNGDPNFFNEEMTMLFSVIGFYATLFLGIISIGVGLYFLIKSKSSSSKKQTSKPIKGVNILLKRSFKIKLIY